MNTEYVHINAIAKMIVDIGTIASLIDTPEVKRPLTDSMTELARALYESTKEKEANDANA